MQLNINSDAVVAHTAKLERLHRTALPRAILVSLNAAAFDVKTNTMPKSAKRFIQRSPTFFKATSKVAPAKGFDIKSMQATVGFIPPSNAKEKGGATKNLEQQEHSGTIGHRAFIPMKQARAGGSWNRNVSPKNRMAAIRNSIKDARKSKAKTLQGKWFSTAMHAGKGGLVLGNKVVNGARMLMRINSIHRDGRSTRINATPLYSVKKNRAVRVKQTRFMQKASIESAKKVERYYIIEAEKQIARLK